MSEFDSLSDSEWLEISSNQGSDNDSLCSRDSDHDDIPSMPPSRRSSMSVGSSVDGEIEAWEGFADDRPEEVVSVADPVLIAFSTAEHAGPRQRLNSEGRASEDQFVTAALEQSLVVHNSLRDLRLSFPDPITSSRDELNGSFEAISSTETHHTDDENNTPIVLSKTEPLHQGLDKEMSDGQQPDSLDMVHPSNSLPAYRWFGTKTISFDIVLYGSTSVQSRDFAQWLLSVISDGGGHMISASGDSQQDTRFRRNLLFDTTVTVTFRDGNLEAPSTQICLERPSLAIVYLPSLVPLPEHTLYLPVFLPPARGHGTIDPSEARDCWALLNIPASRTLRLTEDSGSPVFLDDKSTLVVPPKKASGVLDQLKPVHAVTFVALLSLIMSFAVNTAFRSPTLVPTPVLTPTYTTPATFWGMFGTTPNQSMSTLPTASASTSNMAIMPSTLKDFALAVFNPATTTPIGSLSIAPSSSVSGACGSGTTDSPVGECKLQTRSERVKSTKDVILRPPTALSNPLSVNTPTQPVVGTVAKVATLPVDESSVVTSLSLKVVDSLSEVADIIMKALEEVVARDFKELMGALDDLMRAVGRQTNTIVAESKTRAQVLRTRLQYRNERAKGKARELRQMGEQLVSFAGERLKARAEIAKTRAHSLKKSFMASDAWRTYAQAHGEWSEVLGPKGKRQGGKREHKGLFAKLKERRENRKRRAST
ncbi:hypothetical protein B0H10DRAFT_1946556 [Mycena sp. CBHHK59/15]|nr:hypothetical protein B0H10DRAFT_1946556 [Mycena sp. CBHHK59/15]